MNIRIFYAARKEFRPLTQHWPQAIKDYPFAEFLRNYGWSRPKMITSSLADETTDIEALADQIQFDFGCSRPELKDCHLALEADGQLIGMCKFKELNQHKYLEADSAILLAPDESCWYCLILNREQHLKLQ